MTDAPGDSRSDGVPVDAALTSKLFPIVGIGMSAGGLKAVSSLLAGIPAETGMAFVVVQHLDPNHESQLTAMLARSSHLPIDEAVHGLVVQPNRVYVIMPNTTLHIEQGILRTTPREKAPSPHFSIDSFLRSLAVDRPGNAIGVILSGAGSDGTLGIAAIKAAGGVTFAQDDSADHDNMPQSAIGGGHVDFVLTPAEIATELGKIARYGFPSISPRPMVLPDDAADQRESAATVEDPEHYTQIIGLLRGSTGIDFTHYRSSTIMRRTKRRMALGVTTTLGEYADILARDADELDALARDILIHVTSFFRDHSVFESLKTAVLPALMSGRSSESSLRVWVVGCSTGQEVYSLAIELMEHLQGGSVRPQIQIFATDISAWALAKARTGRYPESIAEEIPTKLLAQYFTRDGDGYRIDKSIRDLCVFAKHDVTTDTPFTHIDLISCRNVLIYLGPVLQNRILPAFHFSLKPGGFLVLGSSESIGQAAQLYETIDEKNRIYRTLPTTGRHTRFIPRQPEAAQVTAPPVHPSIPSPSGRHRTADQIILDRFEHAGVLVSESMEVLQYRGRTHAFLEPAEGEASLNLLSMVPFGIAEVLREAVAEAKQTDLPVRRERLPLRRGTSVRDIAFEVIPVASHASEATFLVLFDEQDPVVEDGSVATAPPAAARTGQDRKADQLQKELVAATTHIQMLVEQNRALVEQLRASQDEAQSFNEEFRSTNEELQTAKEEVESTNEELITINDELRAANDDLGKLSAALRASGELTSAIVETMRYPLLVLDSGLHVESANRAFLDAFQVGPRDTVGRLVYELGNGQWNITELRRLLEDILPANSAFDDFEVTHDFTSIGRRTMLLNARRINDHDPSSRRIVLVIADITDQARITSDLKDTSHELLRSNAELDQFAAVASHDLQEPLRMMTSYIALLQRRYDPMFDDQAREYMGFVTDGAKRMTEMIKAILTYSRIGHEAADVTDIDSSVSFTNALANLRTKIKEANATIADGPLPRVRANREQLTQLFQNILSNALKYRSEARPLEIRVSAVESTPEWTFAIADNGIGMEEASYGKIFQLFQRLHTGSKEPGTGIGLATCKKIIEHHRGRIWVESKIDVGSTFYFTLPK